MSTWYYKLNESEEKGARWYGTSIHEHAVSHSLHDCKVDDKKDGLDVHIEGAAAEWAFAKHHNIFPNTQLNGPDHIDFTLPNGLTVDVKSTDHIAGNLLVPLRYNLDNSAESFALMRGTIKKGFEYVGWIPAAEFFDKAKRKRMDEHLPETWYLGAGFLRHEPIYKPNL
jgi:hypothetical protein